MKVFAAVIASLMLLYVDADCPYGWYTYRNTCYFLSSYENATWIEAVEYCRVIGGYLVDINDDVDEWVVRVLGTFTGADIVWIGGQDYEMEGVWRSSHTYSRLHYISAWGKGQPDKGFSGNCLAIWLNSGYKWADYNCKTQAPFICQRHT